MSSGPIDGPQRAVPNEKPRRQGVLDDDEASNPPRANLKSRAIWQFRETEGAPVAYLAGNKQLAQQVERQARDLGFPIVRRALVGAVAAVAGIFVVMPVAFAIVVNHKARAPVERVDLGWPHVELSLTTSDGLRLAGWYVPSRNGAAVIAFPGRKGPVGHARMLVRHGYGVLLLDRRGEGLSEGDFNARGWGGEPDLHAAIA